MEKKTNGFRIGLICGILFVLAAVVLFTLWDRKARSTWELTQHSDDSGSQAICYSLYNKRQKALIMIDGGLVENADHVRRIIEERGGHVTAWILTHYHHDHCGAFNVLWPEYRDRIDTVYCTPLEWDDVKDVFRDWDSPETMATFLEQTKDAENVKRLYRGDELEICGLKMKVYSAFDEEIPHLGDIPNNCSLMFKISSKHKSALFLGDTHNKAYGMTLLERFGAEELHADYVQAAHHGNNTQSFEFYEAVNPSVLFLDGPEWLMTGKNSNAKETLAWCQEHGIRTYDYRQAPTTLLLD